MPFVTNATTPATASPASVANDIRDIAPPVDIPDPFAWIWWALAGLAIITVALIVWRWLRKRASQSPSVPVIPAHERARRKLEQALDLYDQPKPFCIIVSDAVRLYLEERFGLRAPERTTEEFLTDLSRSAALIDTQKDSLKEFLSACDMVKFAKYEPQRPELEILYGSALRLIEETEPDPLTNNSKSSQEVVAK